MMREILFALFIVNVNGHATKKGYKIKTRKGKVHLAETVTVSRKQKAEETNDYGSGYSQSGPTKWTQAEPDWVPKKTKVEDNISKGNAWVPIDKTTTGDEEVVEAEVLVLGAGMAGITVAARLKEAGVEGVVVVEGSDRIGGRVKDTQFGGITIELGANWVHRLICQRSAS